MQRLLAMLLLILMVIWAGCSDRSGHIEVIGHVTIDGQPLQTGVVVFHPPIDDVKGASASGHLKEDGSFRLGTYEVGDGIRPGTYGVTVISFETDEKTGREVSLIPQKFGSVSTSGLSAEVLPAPAKQVIDLELSTGN